MLNQFIFKINVLEEWIDYNNHMQDAYYGLAFSYAVDHFQDVVGFDERITDHELDAQYLLLRIINFI